MKHKALSMLLALVMVVSLLPIAAIANGAEENTGDEEQEKTVEMGENDSQQGGDGEKSQLPTEENEKTAIQLYVEKKGGATSIILFAMPFRKRQTELAESSVRLKFVKTLRGYLHCGKTFLRI